MGIALDNMDPRLKNAIIKGYRIQETRKKCAKIETWFNHRFYELVRTATIEQQSRITIQPGPDSFPDDASPADIADTLEEYSGIKANVVGNTVVVDFDPHEVKDPMLRGAIESGNAKRIENEKNAARVVQAQAWIENYFWDLVTDATANNLSTFNIEEQGLDYDNVCFTIVMDLLRNVYGLCITTRQVAMNGTPKFREKTSWAWEAQISW